MPPDLSNNKIVLLIQDVLNFLAVGVGIFVVGMIIVGGIQYATAGDSPEAVSKAKQRIMNGLIALLVFIFLFALVQWLVPGGIFDNSGGGGGSTGPPPTTPPPGPPRIGPPVPN